jgi:hypothetical protein
MNYASGQEKEYGKPRCDYTDRTEALSVNAKVELSMVQEARLNAVKEARGTLGLLEKKLALEAKLGHHGMCANLRMDIDALKARIFVVETGMTMEQAAQKEKQEAAEKNMQERRFYFFRDITGVGWKDLNRILPDQLRKRCLGHDGKDACRPKLLEVMEHRVDEIIDAAIRRKKGELSNEEFQALRAEVKAEQQAMVSRYKLDFQGKHCEGPCPLRLLISGIELAPRTITEGGKSATPEVVRAVYGSCEKDAEDFDMVSEKTVWGQKRAEVQEFLDTVLDAREQKAYVPIDLDVYQRLADGKALIYGGIYGRVGDAFKVEGQEYHIARQIHYPHCLGRYRVLANLVVPVGNDLGESTVVGGNDVVQGTGRAILQWEARLWSIVRHNDRMRMKDGKEPVWQRPSVRVEPAERPLDSIDRHNHNMGVIKEALEQGYDVSPSGVPLDEMLRDEWVLSLQAMRKHVAPKPIQVKGTNSVEKPFTPTGKLPMGAPLKQRPVDLEALRLKNMEEARAGDDAQYTEWDIDVHTRFIFAEAARLGYCSL